MLIFLFTLLSFAEIPPNAETQELQSPAQSQKNGKGKGKKKKKKKKVITVPIEIGVGPTAYHFGNMNGSDRTFHTGVSISGQAIISKKLIRQNKHMIPKEYRKMAMAQDEIRISKLWIPESIIISPSTSGTSAVGASFRPIGLSLMKAKKNKGVNVDLGARVTYAYISSEDPSILSPHFLGLGIDGRAELRVPLGKRKGLGIGWASHAYIPQSMLSGGSVDLDPMNWHVGQGFVKYYYRFPYQYRP